jgi:uncharacterized RDD family membrane protein YckC
MILAIWSHLGALCLLTVGLNEGNPTSGLWARPRRPWLVWMTSLSYFYYPVLESGTQGYTGGIKDFLELCLKQKDENDNDSEKV